MGETALERSIRERQRHVRRAVGAEIRRMRTEAGLSIRDVGRAIDIDWSHLARVEAGDRSLSQASLVAVAAALGHDASIRFFPSDGPRVRDRIQVRMVEALLATAHPRWRVRLEVPVYRPVHGVIDVVLHDPTDTTIVACEAHSGLEAVDAQLRWAAQKADSLPSAHDWPWSADLGASPTVSLLLLLRSTDANRALVRSLPETFRVAYPAPSAAAWEALTGDRSWPGPAIPWVVVDGRETRLLRRPPRGIGT